MTLETDRATIIVLICIPLKILMVGGVDLLYGCWRCVKLP